MTWWGTVRSSDLGVFSPALALEMLSRVLWLVWAWTVVVTSVMLRRELEESKN